MGAGLLKVNDLNGPTMWSINADHEWGYVPILQGCQITFTMAEKMTPRSQCVKFLVPEHLFWWVYQLSLAIEYNLCELLHSVAICEWQDHNIYMVLKKGHLHNLLPKTSYPLAYNGARLTRCTHNQCGEILRTYDFCLDKSLDTTAFDLACFGWLPFVDGIYCKVGPYWYHPNNCTHNQHWVSL